MDNFSTPLNTVGMNNSSDLFLPIKKIKKRKMKNLKDILNETKSIDYLPLNKVAYSMVSVSYDSNPIAFVFKSIKEIEDVYVDWDLEKEDIKLIIDNVNKLSKNESYVHSTSDSEYEIITALK